MDLAEHPAGGRGGRTGPGAVPVQVKSCRAARLVLAAAWLPLVGACDSLGLGGEPETARIHIESTDVEEVTLVTAKRFVYVRPPDCTECPAVAQPVNADTSVVSVPFDRTYPFDSRLQFFAETFPAAAEPATLLLVAYVDDREWSRSTRLVQPAEEDGQQQTLQFVYEFRRPQR